MTRDQLHTELVQWLEDERTRYRDAAVAIGMPTTLTVWRPVVTELTEGQMSLTSELRQISPLAVESTAIQLELRLPMFPELPVARALVDAYNGSCFVWTPSRSPKFDNEPVRWVSEQLLHHFRTEYLSSLHSLEQGDNAYAHELATEILRLVEAQSVTLVTFIPLGGIRVESPLCEGGLTLRSLNRTELAEFWDDSFQRDSMPRRSLPLRQLTGRLSVESNVRAALEVRETRSKTEQPMPGSLPLHCIAALQLIGCELHGSGNGSCWIEPGGLQAVHAFTTRLRQWPRSIRELGATDVTMAWELARAIDEVAFTNSRKRPHVALQRFLLAASEDQDAEALIDYVISLEALLLPPSKEGEYRFKFSLYGSWYLQPADPALRGESFKQFQSIYDLRSQLVHGGGMADEQIPEGSRVARRLAAGCLTRGLQSGWKSHEQLQRRSLGVE